jgi:hypothetical protein
MVGEHISTSTLSSTLLEAESEWRTGAKAEWPTGAFKQQHRAPRTVTLAGT